MSFCACMKHLWAPLLVESLLVCRYALNTMCTKPSGACISCCIVCVFTMPELVLDAVYTSLCA